MANGQLKTCSTSAFCVSLFRPAHSVYPSQRAISKGNVAAVEPYIHTPQKANSGSAKSKPSGPTSSHQQPQQQQQPSHQQLIQGLTNLKLHLSHANGTTNAANPNRNSNSNNISVNHVLIAESDETKLARQKLHTKQHSLDFDATDLTDFAGKHADAKYQTLPYSSTIKSSTNKIPVLMTRSPSKIDSNDSDSAKVELEELKKHTVHSIPLSVANKSIATAMANATSPSTSSALQSDSGEEYRSDDPLSRPRPSGLKQLLVPPRKPISSVAPTTVTTTPKSMTTPRVHVVAPNVSKVIATAAEDDKSRPALPPKPAKSGDHETSPQSTHSTSSSASLSSQSSAIPTKTRLSHKAPGAGDDHIPLHLNVDNLPIKAKPLTIRKQPLSEQPRLRTSSSGIKPVQYTSRRIEMPPAFFFPEIEKAALKSENSNSGGPTTTPANASGNSSVADAKQLSPSGSNSSSDEAEKSTDSSVSSDDKIASATAKASAAHNDVVRRPRSSLSDSNKVKLTRRVSFDPLALLLDASLEGELELVQKTAMQVSERTSMCWLWPQHLFTASSLPPTELI